MEEVTDFNERMKILVNGAKYDVSCSSSGSDRTSSGGSIGNAAMCGICHSYTEDGRCISLLKILMSNYCSYDCEYCVNRLSADVPRARITPTELCELVMNFYKRNYIEGLFLSSAVDGNPDKTMEIMAEAVIKLRKIYGFNGYIHLKGIPNANMLIITNVAKYVDRMSFNLELPSEKSLRLLAPQKSKDAIITPMRLLGERYKEEKQSKGRFNRIIPAGQTTQLIVGASKESDGHIIKLSSYLYNHYALKRVYFSAYVPVVKSRILPDTPAGLLREHRLYQADWLMRFYGFSAEEIAAEDENLPKDIDPKEYWALKNIALFPIEVNIAPYEMLLRTPGIGLKSAYKIIAARRQTKLSFDDLLRMGISLKRARHFITCQGKFLGCDRGSDIIRPMLSISGGLPVPEQLSLFSTLETGVSALIGEM